MHRLLVPVDSVRVKAKKLLKLHPKKVQQYERDYECGDEFPPISVENCGTFYTIRDGRHRYIAQKNLGYTMIDVIVVRGAAGVSLEITPDAPVFSSTIAISLSAYPNARSSAVLRSCLSTGIS